MSSVDHSWLRMESHGSNMHIGAILILDGNINLDQLRQLLQQRLLPFSRFRQRVVAGFARAWWEPDADFSLEHHLQVVSLQNTDSEQELRQLAGNLMNQPLDRRHPLWHMLLVNDYQGGSAVIVRIHHCVADGIALVKLLLSLTDEHTDSADDISAAASLSSVKPTAGAGSQRQQQTLGQVLLRPALWGPFLAKMCSALAELVKVTFMPADQGTALKGMRSGTKLVSWAEPFELDDVKRIARATHTTVNDVLVSAVAGALRTYLLRRGANLSQAGLHVTIPFNLRPMNAPVAQLGNQVGLLLLELPVQVDDPLQCLYATQRGMDRLKHSWQPHVFYGVLSAIGKGPSVLEQLALTHFSSKASAIMTNVPGPTRPVYLAGIKVRQPLAWVPQAGSVGLGLAIFTYDNKVQFSIMADSGLIPDPDELTTLFFARFRLLAMAIPDNQPQADSLTEPCAGESVCSESNKRLCD